MAVQSQETVSVQDLMSVSNQPQGFMETDSAHPISP